MNRHSTRARYAVVIKESGSLSNTEQVNIMYWQSLSHVRAHFENLRQLGYQRVRVLKIPSDALEYVKTNFTTAEIDSHKWATLRDPEDDVFLDTRPMSAREELAIVAKFYNLAKETT